MGKLYSRMRGGKGSGRAPAAICSECSEEINFVIRLEHALDGRVYQADAEFPAIASHRFPLRGPGGKESAATVEIGLPYIIDENTAACPVSVTGPIPAPWIHARGAGTLQALCLAISSGYAALRQLDRTGWKWDEPHPDLEILFGRRIPGTPPNDTP